MKLHIADMLRGQGQHLSFHTPGHKRAGGDITELSYSDNLYAPHGVLAAAERDIAEILGADASFLLTDGSTAGVYSMLFAAREAGAKRVAVPAFSHPSVGHACHVLGLALEIIPQTARFGVPEQPALSALEEGLKRADALLLTSPDYYGFFPPLAQIRALCTREKKPFLVDGAHGSHLHFCDLYAGKYADMWVDGVHKSLPAMTQGAVVSAKGEWAERLARAVKFFRTTSPSYPIMASVEYAVKYPRNTALEEASEAFKCGHGCLKNADWTKILYPVGKRGDEVLRALEAQGIYPEFFDGNYLLFYLSPATRGEDLDRLGEALAAFSRAEISEDAPVGAIPIYREDA